MLMNNPVRSGNKSGPSVESFLLKAPKTQPSLPSFVKLKSGQQANDCKEAAGVDAVPSADSELPEAKRLRVASQADDAAKPSEGSSAPAAAQTESASSLGLGLGGYASDGSSSAEEEDA
eukprot:gnl/TRDRNA2_/TRDRNA2_44607_c0_seq1.p1 gnl/TRDRNA2_/TRDRNA2_44607_c0~~gnl/TRDRNA2_/TRDRNA2_44607_c0_seq1.p1  ORF type:complete len:119 (-),score=34.08 gnl/TRDRNA2_/TRDRNA2_44607_c0_seq1:52-408(-)